MVDIESHVKGIPCIIRVTHFVKVKGSHSYNAPSDWDYYGYTEMEYEILDRKGYKAPWLESKIDKATHTRIQEVIAEYHEEVDYC